MKIATKTPLLEQIFLLYAPQVPLLLLRFSFHLTGHDITIVIQNNLENNLPQSMFYKIYITIETVNGLKMVELATALLLVLASANINDLKNPRQEVLNLLVLEMLLHPE